MDVVGINQHEDNAWSKWVRQWTGEENRHGDILNKYLYMSGRVNMREVEITKEPVELYKILKFEGLVSTGGEAKLLIGDGQVTVNGEVETRRRRKMVDGDVIEFQGETFQLQLVL